MAQKYTLRCVNNDQLIDVKPGETLLNVSRKYCPEVTDPKTGQVFPVIAALVNNKLKELSYTIFYPHQVRFIGFNHPDGRRSYIRSLGFVLQAAVRRLFPDKVLVIDHALPSGIYCEIIERDAAEDGSPRPHFITDAEVDALRSEMAVLIGRDLPFGKEKIDIGDAERIFLDNSQPHKAELEKSLGRFFCSIYSLDGLQDSFHGPLVPSTGYLKTFDLLPFNRGFCLQYPSDDDYAKVIRFRRQDKLSATLSAYSAWTHITGIHGVGTLNKAIRDGRAVPLINLSEARHEREYAAIADKIYARRSEVRFVFIAGPSSSGKTSSSLRLAQQCRVLGLNPKVIELDNYFVERARTPRDEDGEYDFEALEAMDLELLNRHLEQLLAGGTVEIPRFDFKKGEPVYEGNFVRLEDNDILIMEGIHALDPGMVSGIDSSRIFRVYASALTSLNLDENNCISTSDTRLLRRIVRDNRVRGINPEDNILRWGSVQRGERKHIFPFQENADALFNSALLYELPLLKYYAEPLLRRIPPASPAFTEATRLLKFLEYIVALQPDEIAAVPPTSIMREFIGGQRL